MSNNEPPQNPTPDPQDASGTSGLPSYGSVEPPQGGTPPPPGAYPPPAPGGYGQQPPQNNQKALISMILGIVSVVLGLCCGFVALAGIAAIVLGIVARKEIDQSQGTQKGSGMALAGIITGAVAIILFVVGIILVLSGAVDYSFTSDFDN